MNRAGNILSLIIKLLFIVGIIAVGVIIYNTCAGGSVIERIDKSLPDKSIAPYDVTTHTMVYKAKYAVANDDGTVTMTGWYTREKNKWIYHPESFTLPKVLKPRISKRID